MNLTSIEFVASRMAANNAKFWRLKDQAGTLLDIYEDQAGTMEESVNKLIETHRALSGNYVIVQIRQQLKEPSTRGGDTASGIFKYHVFCKDYQQHQSQHQHQHQAAPVAAFNSIHLELLDKIKALELSLKEQEYNARLKELEKKDSRGSNIDKLIETFTTIVMSQQKTTQQPIAGPTDSKDEYIKAVQQLTALVGGRDNFIKLTASLVNLQATEPTKFKLYIKALM